MERSNTTQKKLDKGQKECLQKRLEALRQQLELSREEFQYEDTESIQEELKELIKIKKPTEDEKYLIQGLQNGLKLIETIDLIQVWVSEESVDSQHSSHPEIEAIGIVFSPRRTAIPVPKPTNKEQNYLSKVEGQVEAGLKQAMLELFGMGFEDFDLNMAGCLHAVEQQISKEDIYFEVTGYLNDPEFIKTYLAKKQLPVVTKKPTESPIPKPVDDQSNQQVQKDIQVLLQTLKQIKGDIIKFRSSFDKSQTSQLGVLEAKYIEVLNECLKIKETLYKKLNYKKEPTEQELTFLVSYLSNNPSEQTNQQLVDSKIYLLLIAGLSTYEAFVKEKPQPAEYLTIDQVQETLNSLQNFEEQIKLFSLLLFQEKQFLYCEALLTFEALNQTDVYKKMQTELNALARKRDWYQMNKRLIQYFVASGNEAHEVLKHAAMKYFICFTSQEPNFLESPMAIQGIVQTLQKMIEDPSQQREKQIYQQLINFFLVGKIQDAIIECANLPDEKLLIVDKLFQIHNLKHFMVHSELKVALMSNIESKNFPQSFTESHFYIKLTHYILKSRETQIIQECFLDLLLSSETTFIQLNILSLIAILKIFLENQIDQLKPQDFIMYFTQDQNNKDIANQILEILSKDQVTDEFMSRLSQTAQKEQSLNKLFSQLYEKDQAFFAALEAFLQNFPEFNYQNAKKCIEAQTSFEYQQKKALLWSQQMIQCQEQFKYTINDFMKVDLNIDITQLEDQLCEEFKENEKINRDEFVYLLFEMIKNRLSFEPFIEKLYTSNEQSKIQITQLNMFCYLLDSSDSELRSMLYLACSAYMPVPLIANRPTTECILEEFHDTKILDEFESGEEFKVMITDPEKIQFAPMIYNEILFSFEKYMGVLAFKVSSDKKRPLYGCTTLTNKVFNRQFELHSLYAPIANYGQVEIQFDYNFAESKFIQVAEVHGYLEGQELYTLMQQFNIFIIHCFKDDMKALDNVIANISEGSAIIIISHDRKALNSLTVEKQLPKKVTTELKIISVEKLQKIHSNQLANKIKEIVNGFTKDWQKYQTDVHKRLKSYEEFAHFCMLFNQIKDQNQQQSDQKGRQQIQFETTRGKIEFLQSQSANVQRNSDQPPNYLIVTVQKIRDFIEVILKNRFEIKSSRILPMSEIFSFICKNENYIKRNLSIKQEKIDELRKKNEKYALEILDRQPSDLSNQILMILQSQESHVGVVCIIAKLIKCVVNQCVDPKYKERTSYQDQLSKDGLELQKKEQLISEIYQLNQQIDKLQFSMEFLFREFYIKDKFAQEFSMNDPQTVQQKFVPFEKYLTIAQQQITYGQPFEIIDGDNLRFIHGVYQKMQNDYEINDNILVISVIGPQSSGKSLLLNTLFGAQFQSSAGRCTKGVYGCLIDIRQQDQFQHFKKILILDTEGIQNAENKDSGFDNRIVFYILCISHIVLVCNKGEMNAQMQEMIKIAVYALSEYKGLVRNMPQVNIIMNMIPQIDERNLDKTYQSLSESLMKMGLEKNDSHLILNIKKENVFMLPQAYSNQGEDAELQINKPSPIFSGKVQQLKDHIFKYMKEQYQNSMSHTIVTWFEFASNTWERVNNYHDIDKFNNLEQRKQGMSLQQYINLIINEQFLNKQDEVKRQVELIADKELSKHTGIGKITSMQLSHNIGVLLLDYKMKIKQRLQNQYEEYCKEKESDNRISSMYKDDYLQRLMETNFMEWLNIVNSKIQQFFEDKANSRGNKQLQDIVDQLLQNSKQKYSDDQALHLFEHNWNLIIKERESELKDSRIIFDETSENTSRLYRSQVKDFGTREEDLSLLIPYIKANYDETVIIDNLDFRFNQDFLFFTGNQKGLDPEKYFERYEKMGQYVPKLPYYNQIRGRELYNWENVVRERFNFKRFQTTLELELKSVYNARFYDLSKYFRRGTQIVETIFTEIQNEGQKFMIGVTNEFKNILMLIKNKYKSSYDQKLKDYMGVYFIYAEIIQIKENISKFFTFVRKPKANLVQRNYYKYFEPQYTLYFDTSEFVKKQEYYQINYSQDQYLQGNQNQYPPLPQGFVVMNEFNKRLTFNKEIAEDDIPLQKYMNQIQQPENFSLQRNEKTSRHARRFFFKNLNKQFIINEIKKLIIDNVYRIRNDQNNIKDFRTLIECLKTSQDINITRQFCTMDNKLFQRIVPGVNQIVQNIDSELEAFSLAVHEVGISALHYITYTLISSLYIEIRRIDEHGPLFSFQKTKDIERKLFIAKLTSRDEDRDRGLAERASNMLITMITEKVRNQQINEFKRQIDGQKEIFRVQQITKDVENYILRVSAEIKAGNQAAQNQELKELLRICTKNDRLKELQEEEVKGTPIYKSNLDKIVFEQRNLTWNEIIQMYVEPHNFYINYFTQNWKKNTTKLIENLQQDYNERKKQVLGGIIAYFKKFQELIRSKQIVYSTSVFNPQGIKDSTEKQYQKCFNKAFSHYFRQVILQQWDQSKQLIIDGIEILYLKDITLVHQDDLKNFMIESEYREAIAGPLLNEMIQNLDTFIEEFIGRVKIEIEREEVLEENVIVGNKEQDMRQQSTGCYQMCPLCRRKCDINHIEREDEQIHRCSITGHQILGFGGSFHAKNDLAITYGCHEMENKDLVLFEGEMIPWQTFQLNFPQWNFKTDDISLDKLYKENNTIVWNLIGPLICEHYRINIPNCRIKFTRADQNAKRMGSVESTMYILVLDKSSSMKTRSKWIDLIAESKRFLGLIENDPILKSNTKITIITYNDDITLNCENKVPEVTLIDNLELNGIGTNFEKPLIKVKEIVAKYLTNFHTFHCCFLSDGLARFPKNAINSILQSQELMARFKITTVAFGDNTKAERILKPMADSFGIRGRFATALNPQQLQNVLIEMIPVIYRNPDMGVM